MKKDKDTTATLSFTFAPVDCRAIAAQHGGETVNAEELRSWMRKVVQSTLEVVVSEYLESRRGKREE